ncbi:MAG TPA: GTPase [Stellaceae bacterium]|nr:GTPase [Stellaceae bacterium]
MRLRTFTARSMPEAMALVRAELGSDAIILSTRGGKGAISVTAALDGPADAGEPGAPPAPDTPEVLHEALLAHGTPARLIETLLAAALELAAEEPVLALAGALDAVFSFAPLTDRRPGRPLMLVGPPGAGKTVSLAKMATRAVLAGKPPSVISADTLRAGGIAQLDALMRVLGVPLHRAETPRHLGKHVAAAPADALVLIDTAGINPYRAGDRDELADYIAAADAEPVLVLPAGGDVFDATEIARAFRALGSTRLLPTRLDMVHRLGSLLAAADAARLSFADAGITPDIGEGLTPLNPVALSRLLMPEAAGPPSPLSAEQTP